TCATGARPCARAWAGPPSSRCSAATPLRWQARCSKAACAPRCAAWTPPSSTAASPAARSTRRCSVTCPKASPPAARTASSTPACTTARCSRTPSPCAAETTSSARRGSSTPITACRSDARVAKSPIAAPCGSGPWPRSRARRAPTGAGGSPFATRASLLQVFRVPGDVLADEAGDEVVAVVVARLHAQFQRMAGGLAGLAQQFRAQLALEELVGVALVHQQRQLLLRAGDQLGGIPLLPGLAVVAEVGGEGLLAPGHAAGRDDRRERGHAAEAARVLQRDGQRAVAAHRVAADGAPVA